MTARACRTCGVTFNGYGKARYCSEDCRHGTDAGYESGCKCAPCRAAHARNHKQLRYRARPDVPALGTHRRIQALACLGWSVAEQSRRLGRTRSYLTKVLKTKSTVEPATAAAVNRLYDELSMTLCTSPTARRTASDACARGWVPPLAWDDDQIDNPTAQPHRRSTPAGIDEVAVQRVLAGEWNLAVTKDEKTEVLRRWHQNGLSLAEIERRTGWKATRYYKLNEQDTGDDEAAA